MARITKTLIREKMSLYDVCFGTCKRQANKDYHTATVLLGSDNLKEWFRQNRIGYTEQVGFYKDGSSFSTFTVYFSQLPYLNKLNG